MLASVLAALVLLGVVPLRAEAGGNVTASASGVWWVADALQRNSGAELIRLAFYEQTLQQLYRTQENMPPLEAARQIQRLRDQVEAKIDDQSLGAALGSQTVPGFLTVVKDVIGSSTVAKVVVDAASQVYQAYASTSVVDQPGGNQKVEALTDLSVQSQMYYNQAWNVLSEAYHTANDPSKPYFRTAQNLIFAGQVAPSTSSADQILSNNPSLRTLEGVLDLKVSNGQIKTSLAELKTLASTEFAKIEEQQREAQGTLQHLAEGQQTVLEYVADQKRRQAEADAAQAKAAREQQVLSVETSAVYVISTLVGLADPKLGHALQVVGSVAIQVAQSVSKFSELAAKMGGVLNAVGSLAGAALTGNIFSAVMAIIPLFVDMGPTPEEQILQQIGQLRQQLADLGEHLDKRFDAVDQELGEIYSHMMTEFNRIDVALGRIQGGVDQMQASLVSLHDQLVTLEGGLYSALDAGFRRELYRDFEVYLDRSAHTGGDSLSGKDYADGDSAFYSWASQAAFDELAAPRKNRTTGDETLADELTKHTLDANTDYLAHLPAAWNLTELSGGTVPNPHDWYLGARAWLTLQQENPRRAQKNTRLVPEANELIKGGRQVQAMEGRIVAGPLTDRQGAALNPLFSTLLDRYDNQLGRVQEQARSTQARFAEAVHLDPFGGPDQKVETDQQGAPIDFKDIGTVDDLPLSSARQLALVPNYARIAHYRAGQGDVALSMSATWDGFEEKHLPKVTITYGKLRVRVWSSWPYHGRTPLVETSAVESIPLCSEWNDPDPDPQPCQTPDATVEARNHWKGIEPSLAVSTVHHDTEGEVRGIAETYLRSLQTSSYVTVAQGLRAAALHESVQALNGTSLALRDYVELGMPGALAGDEVLSAMLRGNESIFDEVADQQLTRWFLEAATNPPATNAVDGLGAEAQRRTAALSHALAADLHEIRQGHPAGSVLVSTTVDRLALAAPTLLTPGAVFQPTASLHDLGAVKPGKRLEKKVVVANPGVGVLKVTKATITGKGFSVSKTTCRTVEGHATCSVTIRFSSRSKGKHTGTLKLATNTISPGRQAKVLVTVR